jgi:hypothetical protein
MPPELVDELLGINGQEPLRLPCDPQPAADSRSALQQWNAANVTGRNDDRGRNHRDTRAGTRQGDGRVRSATLKEHAWPNARNAACSLEPVTRSKFVAEKEKRFVGELCDLDRAPAAEPVLIRNDGDAVDGIEQPNPKSVVVHRHQSKVHIAELETTGHRDPTLFD